jgi:hypothetical protein
MKYTAPVRIPLVTLMSSRTQSQLQFPYPTDEGGPMDLSVLLFAEGPKKTAAGVAYGEFSGTFN